MHVVSSPSSSARVPDTVAPAFEIVGGRVGAGLIIIADHASNRVPEELGDLGLAAAEFRRHIAWDIGVAALARALAARLDVSAVLSRVSRLVIDANRGEDDPTLVMRLSDGAVVPGNAGVDDAERERRIAAYWRPYDAAIRATIDAGFAAGRPPVIFSLHSYTPVWRGWARPWHCGVLWDLDPRLPDLLIERLRADPTLVVGDNEPYDGALVGDTLYRHGTQRGLAHAILEVRQDLIADAEGLAEWVERLAPILETVMARADLGEPRLFGSRCGPVGAET